MQIVKKILFIFSLLLIMYSCDESVNGPEKFGVLDVAFYSTDSVYVELDDKLICEGKVNYSGIIGASWSQRFEDKTQGIHKIYYKSFLHNKEVEHKFYLEDTLTVTISYWDQFDRLIVRTSNKELWLD